MYQRMHALDVLAEAAPSLLLPCLMALALLLASCASAPKPVMLDGADRVPVNDPATVEKLKRMAAERN